MGRNNVILNNTDFKKCAPIVKQSSVLYLQYYIIAHKEKEHNWNKLQQKLTLIYIGKNNLMSRQQQHHCFNKKQDTHHIKIIFNLKARKSFIFVSWLRKHEKCIVFPKSWCINLNPATCNYQSQGNYKISWCI